MFYHYFADGELEEALEAAGYQVVEKAHITSKSNVRWTHLSRQEEGQF